jgi:hypothetical protein
VVKNTFTGEAMKVRKNTFTGEAMKVVKILLQAKP